MPQKATGPMIKYDWSHPNRPAKSPPDKPLTNDKVVRRTLHNLGREEHPRERRNRQAYMKTWNRQRRKYKRGSYTQVKEES